MIRLLYIVSQTIAAFLWLLVSYGSAQSACSVPFIFQNYTPGGPLQIIDANELNADFAELINCIGGGGQMPLGLGLTTTPGVDNASPLILGQNPLYEQVIGGTVYSAAHTVTSNEINHIIYASGVSAAVPFTVPLAGTPGFESGNLVTIKDIGTHGFTITEAPGGSLIGIPLVTGIGTVGAGFDATLQSNPPNWVVLYTSGGVSSLSITANPCIVAAPNPITSTGTISTTVPFTVPCGGTADVTLTPHSVLLGEAASPVAFATTGTAARVLADQGSGSDPSFIAPPAEIAMFWPGVPPAAQIVRVGQTIAKNCPSGLTASIGQVRVAPTSTTVVNVNQVTSGGSDTNRGTMTWAPSALTATPASGAGMNLAASDLVEFSFQATPDATAADFAITLKCTRTGF